jgi:hypothetical protein
MRATGEALGRAVDTAKEVALDIGLEFIPGYGTIRTCSNGAWWECGLSLAGEIPLAKGVKLLKLRALSRGRRAADGGTTLFHGTDVASARSLLDGAPLDAATAAAAKIDGPAGFFLATHADDAAYFAARRGAGGILRYEFSSRAVEALGGLQLSPLGPLGKFGRFLGGEAIIPTESFGIFNALRKSGDILVTPY